MRKIKVDFETISAAELKKVSAYEYSMHDSTHVACLGFKEVGTKGVHLLDYYQMQRPFKELPTKFQQFWIGAVLSDYVFSAHNAFFEQCIYKNILVKKFGWPAIGIIKWRCTAAKAAAVAIPRSLGDAGEVMKLAIQKDKEGHKVMMKLCKPTKAWTEWNKGKKKPMRGKYRDSGKEFYFTAEPEKFWTPKTAPRDFEILYKYCKFDVLAEEELDLTLPDLTPIEQQVWFADQRINFRGVQVDMPTVNKIVNIMDSEGLAMAKELDTLTMGLVSSGKSRNQIIDYLKIEGLDVEDLKAKTVDDLLLNENISSDAKALLNLRKALSKSSTAKYLTFQRCAKTDGRIRDILLYHAASTGRWGGKSIQPQNFPRGIIKDINEAIDQINSCDLEELKLLYGTNLMPLFSSVLRGMFIASPGKELFVQDWNAIETRVLWWLAEHKDGLNIFFQKRDPYKEMAAAIYNKSIIEIGDSSDERQLGKAVVLGCGYQMGWKKFIITAWDMYRVKVSEELSQLAVSTYREVHWPVTQLWINYERACINATENPGVSYRVGKIRFFSDEKFLWLQLPSGRKLAYKDPSVTWEANQWGSSSKKFKYWAVNSLSKKWGQESSYGGKIVENVVQAVARDLLAEAILRAEKSGFAVLMHSHDEMVAEKTKGSATSDEYKQIMETLPQWAEGLPLKAGGWTGLRYRK